MLSSRDFNVTIGIVKLHKKKLNLDMTIILIASTLATMGNIEALIFSNVNAAMFNSESEGLYGNLIHRKPDLIVIDKSEMKVFVVEISTPFDAFINQCYQTKFDYYLPLCELINVDTLYTCKTVVIIIGATGCVHNKVIAGLKMLGISTRKSKAVAKYLSLSAAIGSKLVWQMRVKAAAQR